MTFIEDKSTNFFFFETSCATHPVIQLHVPQDKSTTAAVSRFTDRTIRMQYTSYETRVTSMVPCQPMLVQSTDNTFGSSVRNSVRLYMKCGETEKKARYELVTQFCESWVGGGGSEGNSECKLIFQFCQFPLLQHKSEIWFLLIDFTY
jgi:hypothetical protein